MARLPRIAIPQQLHYVIQHALDGRNVFSEREDCIYFLRCLESGAKQFKVAIHAYVLLPSSYHLLITPADATGLSKLVQWLGRQFVPYFNLKHRRNGSLWQGRYRATVLEAQEYFLRCCIVIETSPLRENTVRGSEELDDYQWSSYLHHAGIKRDSLISDHSLFWALGNTPFEREANYQLMVSRSNIDQTDILSAVLKGWVLGSKAYKTALEGSTERRLEPAKRGRPRKIAPRSGNAAE